MTQRLCYSDLFNNEEKIRDQLLNRVDTPPLCLGLPPEGFHELQEERLVFYARLFRLDPFKNPPWATMLDEIVGSKRYRKHKNAFESGRSCSAPPAEDRPHFNPFRRHQSLPSLDPRSHDYPTEYQVLQAAALGCVLSVKVEPREELSDENRTCLNGQVNGFGHTTVSDSGQDQRNRSAPPPLAPPTTPAEPTTPVEGNPGDLTSVKLDHASMGPTAPFHPLQVQQATISPKISVSLNLTIDTERSTEHEKTMEAPSTAGSLGATETFSSGSTPDRALLTPPSAVASRNSSLSEPPQKTADDRVRTPVSSLTTTSTRSVKDSRKEGKISSSASSLENRHPGPAPYLVQPLLEQDKSSADVPGSLLSQFGLTEYVTAHPVSIPLMRTHVDPSQHQVVQPGNVMPSGAPPAGPTNQAYPQDPPGSSNGPRSGPAPLGPQQAASEFRLLADVFGVSFTNPTRNDRPQPPEDGRYTVLLRSIISFGGRSAPTREDLRRLSEAYGFTWPWSDEFFDQITRDTELLRRADQRNQLLRPIPLYVPASTASKGMSQPLRLMQAMGARIPPQPCGPSAIPIGNLGPEPRPQLIRRGSRERIGRPATISDDAEPVRLHCPTPMAPGTPMHPIGTVSGVLPPPIFLPPQRMPFHQLPVPFAPFPANPSRPGTAAPPQMAGLFNLPRPMPPQSVQPFIPRPAPAASTPAQVSFNSFAQSKELDAQEWIRRELGRMGSPMARMSPLPQQMTDKPPLVVSATALAVQQQNLKALEYMQREFVRKYTPVQQGWVHDPTAQLEPKEKDSRKRKAPQDLGGCRPKNGRRDDDDSNPPPPPSAIC